VTDEFDAIPVDALTGPTLGLPYLELVRIGPGSDLGVFVPSAKSATWHEPVKGGDVLLTVNLTLRLDGLFAGRYHVTTFSAYDPTGVELSAQTIRALPLAELFASAIDRPNLDLDQPRRSFTEEYAGHTVRLNGPAGDHILTFTPDLTESDQTCLTFTLARLVGRDTNRAVADLLGISPAAAAQRVRRLRQHDLLPPTTQGTRR